MNTQKLSQQLAQIIEQHHLLKHPFYQAWMRGDLTVGDLQDYALQYWPHVAAFPQFVALIYGQAPSEAAASGLLRNLQEEVGSATQSSHPELWKDFAEGLGVARDEFDRTEFRTASKDLKSQFTKSCLASFAKGLGTLYAYESQVPAIADQKVAGLEKFYDLKDEKTLSFFKVHSTADQFHSAEVAGWIDQLSDGEAAEAKAACEDSAKALWKFLDDVYAGTAASKMNSGMNSTCAAPAEMILN